jgi:hypothetical protein
MHAPTPDLDRNGGGAPSRFLDKSSDRFNLLMLEEGEYYFSDFPCHYHPTQKGDRCETSCSRLIAERAVVGASAGVIAVVLV